MKYSIEIGKIVEGSLKRDYTKVVNYCEQLIKKMTEDGETRLADKFQKILELKKVETMSPMNGMMTTLPVDSESRVNLADIVHPDDSMIETILTTTNENQISEYIQNFKNSDKLKKAGLEMSNTLLLYGPPGTGKTNTAYMIARKTNLPLVIARIDSLISSYLGTTAKNMRMLFEYVEKFPCVLLLDEFDAIAKARDDSNELGELKRVVNSLLQNIDALGKDNLVIAATNHHALLDPAVWRRFNYQIELELPNIESISRMIKIFLNNNQNLTEKEILEISVCLEGISGSDIKEIINKAHRVSIISDTKLTKKQIFNEIFIKENIEGNSSEAKYKQAKYLKSKNKKRKVFTLESIGDVIGLSKSYLSNLLKEDDIDE